LLDDSLPVEEGMAPGDHEPLVIGARHFVLLWRQLDARHACLVDALAQEWNRLIRFDDVLDSFAQTLVREAKEPLVLDEPVLSRCRHGSLIPSAPQPKTGRSAGARSVFDDRIPVPVQQGDACLVAVIRGDEVAARMLQRHFVVLSRDENRLDTALVGALAEKLAWLVVGPGERESVDALVDPSDEEGVPDSPIGRGHLCSREAGSELWYSLRETRQKRRDRNITTRIVRHI